MIDQAVQQIFKDSLDLLAQLGFSLLLLLVLLICLLQLVYELLPLERISMLAHLRWHNAVVAVTI